MQLKPVDIKSDSKEKHVMQKYKCINEHIQTLNCSVFSLGLNEQIRMNSFVSDREESQTACRSLFFCCSLIWWKGSDLRPDDDDDDEDLHWIRRH